MQQHPSISSHIDTMNNIHESAPLDHGTSTNIRVIEILGCNSKSRDDPIECKFRTISLKGASSYKALSYMWGPPDIGGSILLNGQPFEVRSNLWNFLQEARRRGTEQPTLWWIDAICIDQQHVKERNHEVALMGEIYATAAYVVVWLGVISPIIRQLLGDLCGPSGLLDEEIDNHPGPRETVYELAYNQYWSRLWIV
jgi:hypothetical protein